MHMALQRATPNPKSSKPRTRRQSGHPANRKIQPLESFTLEFPATVEVSVVQPKDQLGAGKIHVRVKSGWILVQT